MSVETTRHQTKLRIPRYRTLLVNTVFMAAVAAVMFTMREELNPIQGAELGDPKWWGMLFAFGSFLNYAAWKSWARSRLAVAYSASVFVARGVGVLLALVNLWPYDRATLVINVFTWFFIAVRTGMTVKETEISVPEQALER